MTDFSNLTGLEKPLTKLIETVGEGIGEVGNAVFKFDSRKIKRIGDAEALREKELIVKKAEGQAEASMVLERASKRVALEQYNKQVNLENIIYRSSEILTTETVSDRPVDKDWTLRFVGVAQDISDEDIQELLAKILAGEVKQPATYSKRTLEVIRNLSKEELTSFLKFAPYASSKGMIFVGDGGRSTFFDKFGLNFEEYLDLCDAGLMNNTTTLAMHFYQDEDIYIGPADACVRVSVSQGKDVGIPIVPLTIAGAQIARLLKKGLNIPQNMNAYVNDLVGELESKGAKVTSI